MTPAPMGPGSNPKNRRVYSSGGRSKAAASEHSKGPHGREFGPWLCRRFDTRRALACWRVVLRTGTHALEYPPTAVNHPPTTHGYPPTGVNPSTPALLHLLHE